MTHMQEAFPDLFLITDRNLGHILFFNNVDQDQLDSEVLFQYPEHMVYHSKGTCISHRSSGSILLF